MAKTRFKKWVAWLRGGETELFRPNQSQWITVLKQMAPAAPNPYARANGPIPETRGSETDV